MPSLILPSFNAGELSPRLTSRVDLEKYQSGCRTLENFIIMPYGGVNRRPGFQYLGESKDSGVARLIGFNFSVTTNFVLEFGDEYIRFWSNGVQVMDGGPYEITSPYAIADVFAIQYVQINDVMYLVHPSYPVQKLSRLADDDWEIEEVEWDFPAFRDPNETTETLTASATTGTGITLTASAPTFSADNVGGYYRIDHKREIAHVKANLTANSTTAAIRIVGGWEFTTKGIWDADINILRSYDGVTYEPIRTFTSNDDRNISASGTEDKEAYLKLKVFNYSSHTSKPVAYLEANDSTVSGVVKVVGFTSDLIVTVDVVKDIYATTATKNWAEGSWSDRRGHPRTVTLHEQRVVFAGNSAEAQTVWASLIGDFQYFRWSTLDDGAFTFTLASQENNQINWMLSQQVLCIGTTGDEYIMDAAENSTAITPTSIRVRRQSKYGSKHVTALLINEVALFVQRSGRKVREFVYQFEKDGYVSPDLTLLAEHVTKGGIRQLAFQQQPDAILWIVTEDGTLAGLTYERDQNVVGWHRHTSAGGFFESIATIYNDEASDELWALVRRTVDGETVRYVERLDPDFRNTLDDEAKEDWKYLDSGVTVELDPASATVDGLDHLEGETVDILADGAVHPSRVVTGGEVELQAVASKVQVGLGYTSTIKPMPLNIQMEDGTSRARKISVNRVAIQIDRSLGGEALTEPDQWDRFEFRATDSLMDDSPAPFTGTTEIATASGFTEAGDVAIRQREPLPLSILAIIPKFDVNGD